MLASTLLATLEDMLAAVGLQSLPAADARLLQALWALWAPVTRRWLEETARAIAFSINTSTCLLDLGGVIVDGAVNAPLVDVLIDSVRVTLRR